MASNKRILIVDDQQDLREQMAKLLSRSTKKSETVSLVRQMRSRLLGLSATADQESDDEPERGGYEVDVASQGQEALEKVKRALEANKPYSVMFLDMRMPPGWDGLETAKRIREVDKLLEIVIMTAYADHDQETVAKSVGAPDKLLYIKKPFQSEEIFQLALCLTSKWSAEEDERLRKGWLEGLIRGMSRIKGLKADKTEDVCASVLKALLTFIGAHKGLIASLSDGKWKLEHAAGVDVSEAASYINGNAAKLSESRTAQSVVGKYLLPLKREGYSAIAVIYDATTPSDPEWYKLLNLLVMTASEVLSSTAAQNEIRKGERMVAVSLAASKIASCCQSKVSGVISEVSSLRGTLKDETSLKSLSSIESAIRSLDAMVSSLSAFAAAPNLPPASKTLISDLLNEIGSELKRASAGIEISTEISGLASAEALCPKPLVKEAFKAIVSSRISSALKDGAKAVSLKFDIKPDGSGYRVAIEDDGPAVEASLKAKLFEPFAIDDGADSLGIALPQARRLLKAAGIALSADVERQRGIVFMASLQAAPKA